jgi:hypothetical protein
MRRLFGKSPYTSNTATSGRFYELQTKNLQSDPYPYPVVTFDKVMFPSWKHPRHSSRRCVQRDCFPSVKCCNCSLVFKELDHEAVQFGSLRCNTATACSCSSQPRPRTFFFHKTRAWQFINSALESKTWTFNRRNLVFPVVCYNTMSLNTSHTQYEPIMKPTIAHVRYLSNPNHINVIEHSQPTCSVVKYLFMFILSYY